jgi:SAM-dependent methyltransferase
VGPALVCIACGRAYPIRDGVPRLVAREPRPEERRTAEAFAWHGSQFAQLRAEHERHFLDVIAPVDREFFRGKLVLDAGCGAGRHALFAARYGAREVWAVDLGDVVTTAQRLVGAERTIRVVQADMLHPPFPPADGASGFDFIFSLGVIHHLVDPAEAVRALSRLLRPGGELLLWVYAAEGNGVVRRLVDGLRRATTRLPEAVLPLVAWPLAVSLHAVLRSVYAPARRTRLGTRLPAHGDLAPLVEFSFRRNYALVTDQLVAPRTRYVHGHELRAWLTDAGLESIRITSRNGNSWRAWGRRSAA